MASVVTSSGKYALRYTASITGESTTRSVSGLNFGLAGVDDSGPNRNNVLTSLIGTLRSFTTSTMGAWRLISELEVTE